MISACTESSVTRLRTAYPEHADAILSSADRIPQNGMQLQFAERTRGALRAWAFTLPDGFTVQVRETTAAQTYWGGTERGFEEWLLVDAPADGLIAEWVVDAPLRRRGREVEVGGRLVVSAPKAFDGTREVSVRLESEGSRLTLYVSGVEAGRKLLIDPLWRPVASMAGPRLGHAAVLVDGKVLVAGGRTSTGIPLSSSEIYDPVLDSWSNAGTMTLARYEPSLTPLCTGDVLACFGTNIVPSDCDLFSPRDGGWRSSGWADAGFPTGSSDHSAVLLGDGRVLVVAQNLAAAFLFSPVNEHWTLAATPALHALGRAATLADGRVFVSGVNATIPFEIYNPATDAWSPVSLSGCARGAPALAVIGPRVLMTAGNFSEPDPCAPTAEFYDPQLDLWTDAGAMSHPHHQGASLLVGARVHVLGGFKAQPLGGTTATDVFDVDAGTWGLGPQMTWPRAFFTATSLPSGLVLLAGGAVDVDAGNTAELYDPTFGMRCVTGSDCLTGLCADGVCCESSCSGACNSCNQPGANGFCLSLDAGAAGLPSCAPLLCSGSSGTCPSSCTDDAACIAGYRCAGGACVMKRAPGAMCAAAVECLSAFCVDGVCCDSACGGGVASDCLSCATGTCGPAPATHVCRPPGSDCDAPERCDGIDPTCPIDRALPFGTVCRAATAICDRAEVCDGFPGNCPADQWVIAGVPCRLSAGGCDPAETCTGASAACPPDAFSTQGTVCRPEQAICDREEVCTGLSPGCPTDRPAFDGTPCIKGGTCEGGACVGMGSTARPDSGHLPAVDAGLGPAAPQTGCGCSSAPAACWFIALLAPLVRKKRRP